MPTAFPQNLKAPRQGRFSFASTLCFIGAALLVASWMTTEHFLPWVSWHAEVPSFAAAFILALACASRGLRRSRVFTIGVPWVAVPFALLGAVAIAQVFSGTLTFAGDAIVFCFYIALAVTCLVLGFNVAQEPVPPMQASDSSRWSPASWVALTFAVGAAASVVVALAQVFQLWDHSAWIVRMMEPRRPGGNLGQSNQIATLMVMGAASVAFLHVSGKLGRAVSALLALLLCMGVALSESRSGAVGLLALMLWWQFRRKAIAADVPVWAAPVLAACFAAMFLAWPHALNFVQMGDAQTASRLTQGDMRMAVWSQLLQAAWQKPWWGWGVLEVAEAHNSVAHAYRVNNPLSYSHNLAVDLAVWVGLPIAVGLSVLALGWGVRRAKAADRPLTWFCIAAAIPLATHSMLELPFAYAYFLAPVLFLLGVLERVLQARPAFAIGPRTAAVALLAVSGVMLWSVVEYLAIEEDFRIVRFEQLRIGKTQDNQQQPDVILLTQLGALLDASRIAVEPGMSADKLEQLRSLAMRFPWVSAQYRYALALALNGNPAESARQFQVMRWQRDEKMYVNIKRELAELGRTRYPQLLTLDLP
jgi:hypothetical protein